MPQILSFSLLVFASSCCIGAASLPAQSLFGVEVTYEPSNPVGGTPVTAQSTTPPVGVAPANYNPSPGVAYGGFANSGVVLNARAYASHNLATNKVTHSNAWWEFDDVVFGTGGASTSANVTLNFDYDVTTSLGGTVRFRVQVYRKSDGTLLSSINPAQFFFANTAGTFTTPSFAVETNVPLRVRTIVISEAHGNQGAQQIDHTSALRATNVFTDAVGGPLVGMTVDSADGITNNSFTPSASMGPTAPRDVALLDADGDGDLDATTANSSSHDVSLWSNDGAGALTESSVALDAADQTPVAIAAGDLDDDGFADDVVVACADSHTVGTITDVGGTPVAASLASGGLHPTDVAVGDLDAADSRDDVVVAREGEPLSGGDGIAVSLNGGAFSDLTIPAGNATQVVKLGLCDLDGDGDNDLAAVAQGTTDQVLLFDGDGLGGLTFAGAIALPTSGLATGICCGDLDGDGSIDLAVVLPVLFPTPGTDLRVYTYTGGGALDPSDYTAGGDVATGGTFAVDVACGELDGDSMPGFLTRRDVVVVHAGSGDAEAHYGYDATGSVFQSTAALTVGSNPVAVAIGDLNGDCADDVVIANQGSDDLSVTLGAATALTQDFGTGCPGTGGLVPVLTGIGVPSLGNPAFGVQLTNALPFAPVLVSFSASQATTALGGGCDLYLATPIASVLRFTDGAGEQSYVFSVPNDPALLCLDLYLQDAVFDPNGAFASTLALSNAVRAHVGS